MNARSRLQRNDHSERATESVSERVKVRECERHSQRGLPHLHSDGDTIDSSTTYPSRFMAAIFAGKSLGS